jgi:hypothetical protein
MTTKPMTTETEMDDDDGFLNCDHCNASVKAELTDDDGFCPACVALHTTCGECGERVLIADMHPAVKGLCQDCGDSQLEQEHQDALDDAATRLDELTDDIKASDNLELIRRAIKAIRKIKK